MLGNLVNEITISTPFFNEEEGLENYFNTLKSINYILMKMGTKGYFLFIDDGSKDKTVDLLEDFRIKNLNININIVKHDKNYGYGKTLKTAIKECKTDYLIIYDSDCTYDYKIIKNLIDIIKANPTTDIVNVSYKIVEEKKPQNLFRFLLSEGASLTYKLFFKEIKNYSITVFTCSYRIYNLNKVKSLKLLSDDFNSCAELMIRAIQKNFRIKEIPGINLGRKLGKSKMNIIKNIFNSLKIIILIKFNF